VLKSSCSCAIQFLQFHLELQSLCGVTLRTSRELQTSYTMSCIMCSSVDPGGKGDDRPPIEILEQEYISAPPNFYPSTVGLEKVTPKNIGLQICTWNFNNSRGLCPRTPNWRGRTLPRPSPLGAPAPRSGPSARPSFAPKNMLVLTPVIVCRAYVCVWNSHYSHESKFDSVPIFRCA